MEPIDERTFLEVLKRLRDVRAWAVVNKGDPWAFRQAMITVMAIDTDVALEKGVKNMDLNAFDMAAKVKAREFIESIPGEVRKSGR